MELKGDVIVNCSAVLFDSPGKTYNHVQFVRHKRSCKHSRKASPPSLGALVITTVHVVLKRIEPLIKIIELRTSFSGLNSGVEKLKNV
jgi:hypothetical protein